MKRRILIIGGGFAGVKCALELSKQDLPNTRIRLVSDRDNFEYHGALYRLVAGRSPLEVCLPLRDILDESKVDIIQDRIVKIDKESRLVTGSSGSTYGYDIVVMALGAETSYLGIPGLEEYAWGMKTINDALRLKNHITETLALCPSQSITHRNSSLHFVVVGAGPTGVEMAGELAGYVRQLVHQHDMDPQLVRVDLVEQSPRVLPNMHHSISKRAARKLEQLGVFIKTNCTVTKLENDILHIDGAADQSIQSPTVIWTAGVRAHYLCDQLEVKQDKKGRVIVDENLRVPGWDNMYITGDSAATTYSGMAQTAIGDGRYVATCIRLQLDDSQTILPDYVSATPIYAIPVGPSWAATQWGQARFYGWMGWKLRRLVDLVVFVNFLPWAKAWKAFTAHYHKQQSPEVR